MQVLFNRKAIPYALSLSLLISVGGIQANTVEQEIQLLREQMEALSARLNELESSNRELQQENAELLAAQASQAEQIDEHIEMVTAEVQEAVAESIEAVEAVSWAERLSWKGDFRYRYENISVEDSSNRNRSRIRARAQLTADVHENFEVGIGLASGSDDPVSTNQTLGGGGSTKDLGLDLAYFDWSGLTNTNILGGKFKNQLAPVGKNSMLWDSDWRPEGTSVVWDNGTFFANGVGTWLESDSRAGDTFAWIAEAGFRLAFGQNGKLRAGIGAHSFDVSGRQSFFGDGDFFGNSSITIGQGDQIAQLYRFDYEGIQAFAELGWNLFDLPATFYADYVQNQDADEFDTGYIVGMNLGSASAP
ncbi:MAG: putative porin, partial [Pseudomonadota bacterium]